MYTNFLIIKIVSSTLILPSFSPYQRNIRDDRRSNWNRNQKRNVNNVAHKKATLQLILRRTVKIPAIMIVWYLSSSGARAMAHRNGWKSIDKREWEDRGTIGSGNRARNKWRKFGGDRGRGRRTSVDVPGWFNGTTLVYASVVTASAPRRRVASVVAFQACRACFGAAARPRARLFRMESENRGRRDCDIIDRCWNLLSACTRR